MKKYGYPQNIKDIIKNHRIVCKSDPVYYDKQYREILKNSENVRYISNSSGSVSTPCVTMPAFASCRCALPRKA